MPGGQDLLPGLALPAVIGPRLALAPVVGRQGEAGTVFSLPLPPVRGATAWHRHDLAGGGYELRLNGQAIARVLPHAGAWRCINSGSAIRDGLSAGEADALAARIARMLAA